ncbi:MAG: thioredoxin domain-containing protein [Acidobacteria bacterium]|nr:thioredoxin domain-containing protein [Acidobacteriota bacterium]MBA3884734.1 thioredoxin domain-containing protein [Acidobacteriota bacterium]
MLKVTAVALLAILSLSPPQSRDAEIEALKREVAALRAQQEGMARDLQAIKQLLQSLMQPAPSPGNEMPGLVGASIAPSQRAPLGAASARVMILEISDYHCGFCRRHTQQTFPRIYEQYVKTGQAQYGFVDFPITQAPQVGFKPHEAALCAGEQGKAWEMHTQLFGGSPASTTEALVAKASAIGLNTSAFTTCLNSGKYTAAIQESVGAVQRLGVGGTPMTLIGLTPEPGQPMKVAKFVYGAHPFEAFKEAIDEVLAEAR